MYVGMPLDLSQVYISTTTGSRKYPKIIYVYRVIRKNDCLYEYKFYLHPSQGSQAKMVLDLYDPIINQPREIDVSYRFYKYNARFRYLLL